MKDHPGQLLSAQAEWPLNLTLPRFFLLWNFSLPLFYNVRCFEKMQCCESALYK